MSSVISPKLTTIDQPGYLIGQKSASLLLQEINQIKDKQSVKYETIELPTTIIEREST